MKLFQNVVVDRCTRLGKADVQFIFASSRSHNSAYILDHNTAYCKMGVFSSKFAKR